MKHTSTHKKIIPLNKLRRGIWRSDCCNAPVKSESGVPDFASNKEAVTMYIICKKCGKPCNLK